jgi:hypothetical protein
MVKNEHKLRFSCIRRVGGVAKGEERGKEARYEMLDEERNNFCRCYYKFQSN